MKPSFSINNLKYTQQQINASPSLTVNTLKTRCQAHQQTTNPNLITFIMTKITAVIPIRSGSQRVEDKNLRPFANTTLMENKIEMLLNVQELDNIIVNTNSEEAIEIVKKRYRRG